MDHGSAYSGFGIHIVNDNLIVPVNGDLDDDSVKRLQREILDTAQKTTVKGVIIDVSAVRVIDSLSFTILADTSRMVTLLGAKPIFVGFQAGAASALLDLDVDITGITTALSMEDGLDLLRSMTPRWKIVQETEGEEPGIESNSELDSDESDDSADRYEPDHE